jgi:tetratricopeptide (TPR) repeat protein
MAANSDLQALQKQGKKAFENEQYENAARLFVQAVQIQKNAGDEAGAAESANNASVAFLKAGLPSEAMQSALGTDETFAHTGDVRRQGIAIGNIASAHEALGNLDVALECYRQSADLLKEAGDGEYLSFALQNLSTLQLRTGHQLEALATMQGSLENRKKLSLRDRILKKFLNAPFKGLK